MKAGDSNEPSYTPPSPPPSESKDDPPPAPPVVDNNGDDGTGYGGADDPTPIEPEVTYTDPTTGDTNSFNEEPPGEEWDIGDG